MIEEDASKRPGDQLGTGPKATNNEGDLIFSALSEIDRLARRERQKDSTSETGLDVADQERLVRIPLWVVNVLANQLVLVRADDVDDHEAPEAATDVVEPRADGVGSLIADLDLALKAFHLGIQGPAQAKIQRNSKSESEGDAECFDGGRAGVMAALTAVRNHLKWLEVPAQLLKPFIGLGFALLDLDNGVTHPLLWAAKVNARRPHSREHESLRVVAAASMDLYMQHGFSKTKASVKVTEKLVHLKVTFHGCHGGIPTANTVARWRDNFQQRSKNRESKGAEDRIDPYALSYQRAVKYHEILGLSPTETADRLLRDLHCLFNVNA